jgi:activating signal cointegrator complex subunit 2
MVPFPEAAWRNHLVPQEWEACLEAWISLVEAHLSLEPAEFTRLSAKDESLPTFLMSFAAETSQSPDILSSSDPLKAKQLRKHVFLLSYRLLEVDHPPEPLLRWQFLADISKVYGKSHAGKLNTAAWKRHVSSLEASMGLVKSFLIKELDSGLKGDLKTADTQLKQLNHLLHASPEAAAFFMAGSDFMDSLISCYKIMNPPLRKAILSTLYLCLIGLTEEEKPNFSSLVDQLYSLKIAAEAHKSGPTNVNDSLVAELVTVTPILKQVQHRIEASGSGSNRAKSVINALDDFRKPGGTVRPHHLMRRKINKGKGAAKETDEYGHGSHGQIHIHRMSLITQVQDLFPDLGSGFIVKLLNEYNDDVEQVISHLLEGSLPSHLEQADRSEEM